MKVLEGQDVSAVVSGLEILGVLGNGSVHVDGRGVAEVVARLVHVAAADEIDRAVMDPSSSIVPLHRTR
jgi:hypothetical protein